MYTVISTKSGLLPAYQIELDRSRRRTVDGCASAVKEHLENVVCDLDLYTHDLETWKSFRGPTVGNIILCIQMYSLVRELASSEDFYGHDLDL